MLSLPSSGVRVAVSQARQQQIIENNIEVIQFRINQAAQRSGRTLDQIQLVAIGKNHSVSCIQAAIDAGLTDLGENRVQEAKSKKQLIDSKVRWHLVGHLQTNKAKAALDIFDLIHSVDRLRLMNRIQELAKLSNRKVKVLIQVNTSAEPSKFGIMPEQIRPFFDQVASLDRVAICGLMTIARFSTDPETCRPYFRQLRALMAQVSEQNYPNFQAKYLSMGMSNDFEVAIEEGANLVRIGTSIFGNRPS